MSNRGCIYIFPDCLHDDRRVRISIWFHLSDIQNSSLISDQIVLLNCIFEYKNHSSISSMAGYPQLIEHQIQRVGIRYICWA
jgi:hypothetical protein